MTISLKVVLVSCGLVGMYLGGGFGLGWEGDPGLYESEHRPSWLGKLPEIWGHPHLTQQNHCSKPKIVWLSM